MSDVRALQVWKGKLKAFVLTAIFGGAVLAWAGPSVVHVTPAHIRVLAVPTNDDCTTCYYYYYYYYRHHRRHSGAPNAGPGIRPKSISSTILGTAARNSGTKRARPRRVRPCSGAR
jgi:hypothetical protein